MAIPRSRPVKRIAHDGVVANAGHTIIDSGRAERQTLVDGETIIATLASLGRPASELDRISVEVVGANEALVRGPYHGEAGPETELRIGPGGVAWLTGRARRWDVTGPKASAAGEAAEPGVVPVELVGTPSIVIDDGRLIVEARFAESVDARLFVARGGVPVAFGEPDGAGFTASVAGERVEIIQSVPVPGATYEVQLLHRRAGFPPSAAGHGGQVDLGRVTGEVSNRAPVAVAGDDVTVPAGQTILLSGAGSYDEDGEIAGYEWREGTTVVSRERDFDYVGAEVGTHVLQLFVEDDDGARSVGDPVTITVEAVATADWSIASIAGDDTVTAAEDAAGARVEVTGPASAGATLFAGSTDLVTFATSGSGAAAVTVPANALAPPAGGTAGTLALRVNGETVATATYTYERPAATGYTVPAVEVLRVAPGLDGFGTDTAAGRRGRIMVVDTLAPDGPGSLMEAIQTREDRIILFNVAGEIKMPTRPYTWEGQMSVYGQSAPGDGVVISSEQDHPFPALLLYADDIFLQHLRVRARAATETNTNKACIDIGNSNKVIGRIVVDHCSLSWAPEELLGIWHDVENVTISNCLMYEALYHSTTGMTGKQSYPVVMGSGANRISLVRNVLATGDYRMPSMFSSFDTDVFNNIIYGYSTEATVMQCIRKPYDTTGNVHQNLYICPLLPGEGEHPERSGPEFQGKAGFPRCEVDTYISAGTDAQVRANVAGNGLILGRTDPTIRPIRTQYNGNHVPADHPTLTGPVIAAPRPPAIPLDQLEATLLDEVGARAPMRDAADARIIQHIRDRYVQMIDCVDGGVGTAKNYQCSIPERNQSMPTYASGPSRLGAAPDYVPASWKGAKGLAAGNNARVDDTNGDGYTDLEDYLAELATP